tara:strand:- start:663 stop:1055 length:393 start_codon:yes stop_codon:yes gene_type:complete
MPTEYSSKIKVYYEDTDAGGVVYYANYLKYLERARTEAIFSVGISNKKLLNDYNTLIIVKSCNIDYKKSAKLEDVLNIKSKTIEVKNTSFLMQQNIFLGNELIVESQVRLVCVDKLGKPTRIPQILQKLF